MKIAALVLILNRALVHASTSYWASYPGNATEECVVEDGQMVPISCCENAWFKSASIASQFPTTCFVIPGLLGEGGGSLMSYLGCDGESNAPTYGEDCYGENNGIIPDGVVVNNTDVDNAAMCGAGCGFLVTGNGCQKIRDFSSLPGFENDTTQVYLLMDEHCEKESSTRGSSGALALLLSTALAAIFLGVY